MILRLVQRRTTGGRFHTNERDSSNPNNTMQIQACLRVVIAMVHLDAVHEGLMVGRNIAPDAMQV